MPRQADEFLKQQISVVDPNLDPGAPLRSANESVIKLDGSRIINKLIFLVKHYTTTNNNRENDILCY